jgi:hypothetical protein
MKEIESDRVQVVNEEQRPHIWGKKFYAWSFSNEKMLGKIPLLFVSVYHEGIGWNCWETNFFNGGPCP